MSGATHPWILRPALTRVRHLTFALLAAFALVIAGLSHRSLPSAVTSAATAPATVESALVTEAPAEWPRAALRLWFLLPQLLPRP